MVKARDPRLPYVEQWGLAFEESGLPRIAGRIWGWLLVCDPPHQSPQELAAALGASKGSVSTNTRLLEHAGLIERTAVAGSRRTHYRLRPDGYETMMLRKLAATDQWLRLAEEGLTMAARTPAVDTDRLDAFRRFYAFIGKETRAMLKRWQDRQR